jgi:hypothetical protein
VSLGWPPQRPVTAVTAVTPQVTPHKSVTACNRCNRLPEGPGIAQPESPYVTGGITR